MASRVEGDYQYTGAIQFSGTVSLPNNTVSAAKIPASAGVEYTKLQQKYVVTYGQNGTMTSVTIPLHIVHGVTGGAIGIKAGSIVACIGAATCTIDLKKNGTSVLTASPVRQHIWPKGFDDFYAACQAVDEWSGTPHDGTSVRAAFKVLQAAGYVSEYRWAFDVNSIVNQILTSSPVVAGTDWTDSLFEPDAHGFIRVSTDGSYNVVGGHAYLLSGVDRKKKCPDGSVGAFQITNSWGPSWAVRGQAWISLVDFGILLNHAGEAAVAMELKVKR
jgi:hypothetical protein